MKRTVRVAATAVGVLLLTVLCCLAAFEGGLAWLRVRDRQRMEQNTTPLDPVLVQELCQKLTMPKDSRLCKPGATVYAVDFYLAIEDTFKPGISTYEEVQETLGRFQYERKAPVFYPSLNLTIFACWYDLSGDGMYYFTIHFTDDGKVYRVNVRD